VLVDRGGRRGGGGCLRDGRRGSPPSRGASLYRDELRVADELMEGGGVGGGADGRGWVPGEVHLVLFFVF
jgi:hypothetical protein